MIEAKHIQTLWVADPSFSGSSMGYSGGIPGWGYALFEIDTGGETQTMLVNLGQQNSLSGADQVTLEQFASIAASATVLEGWAEQGVTLDKATAIADEYAMGLVNAGIFGTEAADDSEVMELFNSAWMGDSFFDANGDFSFSAFESALALTDYYHLQTERQARWNDPQYRQADKDNDIITQAQRLMQLQSQYTGEQLTWTDFSTDGDMNVSIDELRQGNSDLTSWAERIASGQTSEQTAVLEWLQPAALEIDNSPYNRTLENEIIKQGQSAVSKAGLSGDVSDLRARYGLESSQADLASWGNKLYMNEGSIEELEEQFKLESQALYPNKPLDVDWNTWASPYQTAFQDVLETYKPDFRDPTLQSYLTGTEAPNLYEFKKSLRQDSRWESTKNAKDSYYRNFSLVGQKMGFA